MKKAILLFFLCLSGYAHEITTHKRIGDAAVAYLLALYPDSSPARPLLMGTVSMLQARLQIGAEHEDDGFGGNELALGVENPYGRFIFHFTPALQFDFTFGGQTYPNIVSANGCASVNWAQSAGTPNGATGCSVSCNIPEQLAKLSSTAWAGLAAACALFPGTAEFNTFRWEQDLTADILTGAPSANAVEQFGYVVHLLEDLGSPPHTRNDLHPCPAGVLLYCDQFEKFNDNAKYPPYGDPQNVPLAYDTLQTPGGVWANFLAATIVSSGQMIQVIPTTNLKTPADYLSAMQVYTSKNYYSNRTVFAQSIDGFAGVPAGPASLFSDNSYFYGACLVSESGVDVSVVAGTCQSVTNPKTQQAALVRKIAHKGLAYWASCDFPYATEQNCDVKKADIDQTVAREQFAELGPVIAQHVAAFLMFYAPALTVTVTGGGTVTSSPGNGIDCAGGQIGTCQALFVQGAQIILTANLSPGANVTWGGACASAGTASSATVTLTGDATCTANFNFGAYTLVDLGPYACTYTGSRFGAPNITINNYGQIAGTGLFAGGIHACVYSLGLIFDLGSLGGSSYATGINNAGVVVGWSYLDSTNYYRHAFALNLSGGSVDLSAYLQLPGGDDAATAINDNGEIVGTTSGAGFLYAGGTLTMLRGADEPPFGLSGVNPNGGPFEPAGINNAGEIVGSLPGGAGVVPPGSSVATYLGYYGNVAIAVSGGGQIVEYAHSPYLNGYSPGFDRAYFLSSASILFGALIGTPSGCSVDTNIPTGVNSSGEVVGNCSSQAHYEFPFPTEAFLYAGGMVTPLHTLVSLPAGVDLVEPAINDRGQIAAVGNNAHMYLLSPANLRPAPLARRR